VDMERRFLTTGDPATWTQDFAQLKEQARGAAVQVSAPSLNMLLTNKTAQLAAF